MTLKQTFIINSDLKMSAGKIAVQVAHGEVLYMKRIMHYRKISTIPLPQNITDMLDRYRSWAFEDDCLMKKVVLKAREQDVRETAHRLEDNDIWHAIVKDRGLTQIAPDSLTCLVVEPLDDCTSTMFFGLLKLL